MLTQPKPTKKRTPTYEILEFFPYQGEWSEAEYLELAANTNRVVELSEGHLEVHDMPTDFHQLIVVRLISILYPFVLARKLGHVRVSPLPVRLWPGKFREPDLIFMSNQHASRIGEQFWECPDLVVEVLSEGSRNLDRVQKKAEYARAGIPEYWIVDPQTRTVEVYRLENEQYALHHTLTPGDRLTSHQFPGLELSIEELFAREED